MKEIVIAVAEKDDKFLMIKKDINDEYWSFPSAVVDKNQSPQRAVLECILETTGVICGINKRMCERIINNQKVLSYWHCTYRKGELVNNGYIAEWVSKGEMKKSLQLELYSPIRILLPHINEREKGILLRDLFTKKR